MALSIDEKFYKDKKFWLTLAVINTFIAIFLSLVTRSYLWENFVYSQCIGFSIASLVSLIKVYFKEKDPNIIIHALAVVIGVSIGLTLATLLTGRIEVLRDNSSRELMLPSFIYSVMIGSVVVFYFSLISKQQRITNQLNIEKLKKAEYEKALTENNLKLLQAQIEPHFLFNTLSNVLGLIDSRPDDAKKMLEHFTQYLRGSLSRTRENNTTLKDEVSIVKAYLSIQKNRMGKRLNYSINVDETAYELPFPPLLIQPLVENSISHGLESEIDGGEVNVDIKLDNKTLLVCVSDTGKGAKNTNSNGIGLKNIHARLSQLFCGNAEIITQANQPKGLVVTLHIPLENL